jgi:hypothetical protein
MQKLKHFIVHHRSQIHNAVCSSLLILTVTVPLVHSRTYQISNIEPIMKKQSSSVLSPTTTTTITITTILGNIHPAYSNIVDSTVYRAFFNSFFNARRDSKIKSSSSSCSIFHLHISKGNSHWDAMPWRKFRSVI